MNALPFIRFRRRSIFTLLVLAWCACSSTSATEAPNQIDLLIIHTPAVTAHYSGLEGVEAQAHASVHGTNIAFENSEIPVTLNLVGVVEIPYTESASSMFDDLAQLSGFEEVTIDEDLLAQIQALRDAHGADLVTLFRRGPADGVAGIAYRLDAESPQEFAGYGVVSDEAALSKLVLAHELGHNLSAGHARDEPGDESSLDYSRGYKFSANGQDYRTIMSNSFSHIRIPHFSNPNVSFEGVPTGVPVGDPDQADAASAFAISSPGIAAFRIEQTNIPTFLQQPIGATVVSGKAVRLQGLVRGFPPLDIQWYLGEIGDRSNPLASTEQERERGGTDTILITDPLSGPTNFWIEAENPNDTTASEAIEAMVIPLPAETSTVLVAQDFLNTYLEIRNVPIWQEMTFSASYLHQLDIRMWREGSPSPIQIRFEEMDGPRIFESTVSSGAVNTWPNVTTVSFDIQEFVVPGRIYRITLTPAGDEINGKHFNWGAGNGTKNPEAGIGENNALNSTLAFVFTAKGRPAWTYHTWARDQGIPLGVARPNASSTGDGMPNLVRYALGFEADAPRALIGPIPQGILPSDQSARFIFNRRKDALDVGVIAESSTDLVAWNPVGASQIEIIGEANPDQETIEVSLPLEDNPAGFLRIAIERPPND